jgi:hypothetical protein
MAAIERRACADCKWMNRSWRNLVVLLSSYGCNHPKYSNSVTGRPDTSCRDARSWSSDCGSEGRLFSKSVVEVKS